MLLIKIIMNMNIKNKLLLLIMVIAIIPIIILGIYSYYTTWSIIKDKETKYINNTLIAAGKSIESLADSIINTSIMLFSDKDIQQSLRINYEKLNSDKLKLYNTINQLIIDISVREKDIRSIMVMDSEKIIYSNDYILIRKDNKVLFEKWYDLLENLKGIDIWLTPIKIQAGGKDLFVIPNGRLIRDIYTFESLGAILIFINETDIYKYIRDISDSSTGLTIVLKQDGTVISSTDRDLIGINISSDGNYSKYFEMQNLNHSKIRVKKYINDDVLINHVTLNNGWIIFNLQPYNEINEKSRAVAKMAVVIAVICFIISVITALLMSEKFSSPIKKLQEMMSKVEQGDLDIRLNFKYNDEIGSLGRSFNSMVSQVKNMMETVKNEQSMKRRAQFNALQAQINPHFMYNSLDTVKWMAEMGMNTQIAEMISSLAKFYRFSLSEGADFVTIEEEVKHIKEYVNIQKFRYGEKISLIYHFDSKISSVQIIKFTLQPLVENSIYHGLKKVLHNGVIKVKVMYKRGLINIYVIDNGLGITHRDLYFLKKNLYSESKELVEKFTGSYGLKNVYERLKVYYGNNFSMKILSKYNIGTIIIIRYSANQKPEEF